MSSIKRHGERQQELYDIGRGLCLESGPLAECESHPGTYFDGGVDLEDAYRLANSRITKGLIELKHGEDRKTITDAVQDAYEDNSGLDSCPECDEAFGRN